MEHEFDDRIWRWLGEGVSVTEIARRIGRSESYVRIRVGIKDPLGPMARDPGRDGGLDVVREGESGEDRAFRRYPIDRHKAGGW